MTPRRPLSTLRPHFATQGFVLNQGLSLRNRELLNLGLVGLLTAAGFASVYIARSEVVSAASLSYAAFFVALFLVAHVVLRVRLPHADPYLLPLGGLLCAVGLTELYRIRPELAFRQGLWVVVGVGVFGALVVFLRDYRELDNVKYILGVSAIVLLVLPALPVIGRTINGATLWVDLGGPLVFQPGELAKVFFVIFLAGYLQDNRELLSYGPRGQGRLPSPKHLGPAAPDLGRRDARALPDTGPRRRAPLLRHLPRHALHGHGPLVVRGRRAGPLPRRRGGALPGDSPRAGPGAELARPLGGSRGPSRTSSSSPSTRSRAAASSAPGSGTASSSRRPGKRTSPSWRRTSSSPPSPRSSAWRARRA